jgi:hypothetical protein
MNSFARLRDESNKIGVDFLLTELDTAFTFLEVADTTASAETRLRNRTNALKAYGMARGMEPRVIMEPGQKLEFERKVATLRKRLQELGFEV